MSLGIMKVDSLLSKSLGNLLFFFSGGGVTSLERMQSVYSPPCRQGKGNGLITKESEKNFYKIKIFKIFVFFFFVFFK